MRTILTLAALAILPSLAGAQTGWRKVTDAGSADSVLHDRMPPGWHVTSGPATILYDPANLANARFAIEAEIHLFPGQSTEGFGVFLGGSGLGAAGASWTAFLITRDGSAIVERRHGNGVTSPLYPRSKASSVKPHEGGDGTAFNTIRVLVQGDSAIFSANGQRITAIPSRDLGLDGMFGFRVGKDLNLHITNLDLVTRLAPFPNRR